MAETHKLDGYHRLALLLARFPDLAIPRRFMYLNAYNLVSLQAELSHLEDEFKDLSVQDRQSNDPKRREFAFCISTLKSTGGQQWSKIEETREKLKEYYEAYTRFQTLASASPPNKLDLHYLRDWLSNKEYGAFFLDGIEALPWEEEFEADLTSLTSRDKDKDALSRWINARLVPLFHRILGYRLHDPVLATESSSPSSASLGPGHYYPDSYASAIVNAFCTILSSLLPTMPIFVLYFIHSTLARMAAIVGFTFLFSTALTIIGQARRIDCFAATTAFTAVLVVFVSVGNV